MLNKQAILMLSGVLFCMPAFSSSDDSWDTLFSEAYTACLKESNLTDTKASRPIIFSDDAGILSYLITGKIKKSKQTIHMLCLYDKNKKRAELNEYTW